MTLPLAFLLAVAATPSSPPARDAGEDVKAADVAMARAVAAHDPAAFAAFLDPEAMFASASGLSRGRAGVVDAWKPYLTPGGPALAWRPERAFVSSSGDLSVTTGRFTWTGTVDGKPSRAEGEYVTVWRRSDDGRWRVIFDASLEPASALGPGVAREPVLSAAAGDLEATLGLWRRGADEGAYLVVSRGTGPARRTVVDSAFAFKRRG